MLSECEGGSHFGLPLTFTPQSSRGLPVDSWNLRRFLCSSKCAFRSSYCLHLVEQPPRHELIWVSDVLSRSAASPTEKHKVKNSYIKVCGISFWSRCCSPNRSEPNASGLWMMPIWQEAVSHFETSPQESFSAKQLDESLKDCLMPPRCIKRALRHTLWVLLDHSVYVDPRVCLAGVAWDGWRLWQTLIYGHS